ncbi:MAG: type II toxin-antitoxin system HicA family toxin [Niveispirillum sp.]|uniref:type II toxin-antitoxin system HicA family toxin n=1 Tax=Niveispirillum sp. TaxID=1917217 RepID=UPI003BA7D82D
MNARQARTLAAVFKEPSAVNIEWSAIKSLLMAVGCRVVEGDGSRVRFERDGVVAIFHHPHPGKEAKRYQARDARAYLTRLGVKP